MDYYELYKQYIIIQLSLNVSIVVFRSEGYILELSLT